MFIFATGTGHKARRRAGGAAVEIRSLFLLMLLLACPPATWAATASPILTARAQPRKDKPAVEFFTSVKPVYDVVIRSSATGTLKDIHIIPGDHVTHGEKLARLGGATYDAALASAHAADKAAVKALALARDQLKVARARYPLLVDRGAVDRSKLAVARDRKKAIEAKAALSTVQKHGILTAPVSGTVTRITSNNGERVSPGDRVATIQPASRLWLVGSLYGRDIGRIRPGMRGQFQPASGAPPIPVHVIRMFPRNGGNGLGIGLEPDSPVPHWFSGEGGMVSLDSPSSNEPAVPDSALVLYKGHWWVIRKSNGHLKPVRVVPNGSRNGWTWISAGLRPGTSVVVSNAYLIFHKSFASKYSGD